MARAEPSPIVDFGTHYYEPMPDWRLEDHREIEAYAGAPICTDVEAFLERYAAAGVDAAVISEPMFMGASDAEAVAAANDALLEVVNAHEELYGLAAVPTAAGGEAAAAELERSIDAGFHGGALATRSDGIELIDDPLEPVFEVADRTGAPLLVHPTLNASLGADVLSDHWYLNVIFGREVAMAESISKVIHEGVYDRYPDLALVFHHNGGNIATMLGRIEGSLARAHRSGADHLKSYDEFEHLLETRVFVDTAGYYGDVPPFRVTLERLPAENVLFATDFPYETVHAETFEEIVDAIRTVRAGADREAILGGNALELLVNVD